MTKLITPPDETNKFVKYLYFLDNCNEKIVAIEKVLGYALRAFQIMKEYRIMVNDDEKESYLDMEEFLKELKSNLEAKVEAKQDIIDQLAESLQNDIKLIFSEVAEVGEEILKPWLIDETSSSSQVREILAELMERLHHCQELSQEYRKYQKEFRIDVTRFDTLDVVLQEVRLRQLLWDSVQQWKDCYEEW